MTDYERLAACMREFRLAKVTLDAEGNVRTMIALPPEPAAEKEDLSPEAIRREAEALMFAHVEGGPMVPGSNGTLGG